MIDLEFLSRDGREEDTSYVYSTWLQSYRNELRAMRTSSYFALQQLRVAALLARSKLLVLHPAEADLVIAAWVVRDEETIHYVYVRHEHRNRGLASSLVAGARYCTHLTNDGRLLRGRLGIEYMPHFLDSLGAS